ncbi:DEAD/DEAH box helicase [Pantanalinema sp. GBBB05]|uniref:DEAD/DEAH box helicase n=1 Tax=Pantanalinema sp. GBBB05 TaxID=2604139 RepID=UPI001DF54BB4|nr:DEAD/DEAH box helicase [Pantanalinema sp. GBBB05]
MAILHGSWILEAQQTITADPQGSMAVPTQGLLIWGEVWRRLPVKDANLERSEPSLTDLACPPHPFAMSPVELVEWLRSLHQSGQVKLPLAENWLTLPTDSTPSTVTKGTRKGRTTKSKPAEIEAVSPSRWRQQTIALPSYLVEAGTTLDPEWVLPQLSASTEAASDRPEFLYPWQVHGILLSPNEALQFLNALPLGSTVTTEESWLGSDLRFWSHIARWSLDLLARCKFLPGLQVNPETEAAKAPKAIWEPLLESGVDQIRLTQFCDRMPSACRTYQSGRWGAQEIGKMGSQDAPVSVWAIDLPTEPQVLLHDFLQSILDAQVRQVAGQQALPNPASEPGMRKGAGSPIASPMQEWLQALGQEAGQVTAEELPSLRTALETWTIPLQSRRAESQFRTCLYLHPPEQASQTGQINWRLEYFLQLTDQPEFLVSAATIWNNPVERLSYRGKTVIQPQETFLMGLGLASRLYAPIEPSLQASRPQFCTLTPIQAYDFLKSAAWRLQDSGLGVIVPPSLANQGGWANRLGLRIQAQTGKLKQGQRLGLQSLLNFRWELTIGGQSLTKEEFDRLVALNTPLVEINGEWVELRSQDIRAAQSFFASRKDQPALSLEDALRISTGDTQMIEKLPVVSFEASGSLEALINTLTGKRTIEAIETPESFQGELRPYQSRGVGWLAFLEQWGLGACLADDMGLGKTPQLIAFLLHLKQQEALTAPTLIVCPTSVLGNWEREVKRFAPSLKVLLHHGEGRPKGKGFAKAVQSKDVIITSYALVQRDVKDLQTVSWQGIVLDEAQNIKNPDAKQSQAVRQLEAQFRIALTGTPVENRLSELWSILDFLNPAYLGPKNFFQRRFATPIERYGDTSSLQTLRSLVQPFILRRLKTDKDIIQDLPEKQEMTVFCGLTNEQASLYQHMVEKSLAEIDAAEGIQRKGIILALLTKLKQICNHPTLFLKESDSSMTDGATLPFDRRSGKVQRLEEMLEEVVAEGDRALIFTQFAEWGKLLKAHLDKQLGRETLFLYGSTSKKQREEMIDRFQHDPQAPRIFILSLKAGGVGLNLTRANHVFHFDRWWNPAVENQATDRVFRIGQTRNVQVHKFVCSGTLEEKIHDLIESKKALAEQVVGAGENWLTELNTDQLRDLLLLDRSAVIGEE